MPWLEIILGGGVLALIVGLVVERMHVGKKLGQLRAEKAAAAGSAQAQVAAVDALSKVPNVDEGAAEILREAQARDRLRAES